MTGRRKSVLLMACLATAGCGSSSSSTPSTGSVGSSASSTSAGAPAALAGVRGRVLRANELKGFSPQYRRFLGINATSWVVVNQYPPAQRASTTARLQHLGFVAGVRENLVGSGGLPGLSTVEQFRTPGGARTNFAVESRGLGSTRFAIPGVPGARGFATAGVGANVLFADGPYVYLIGAAEPPSTAQDASIQSSLARAAQSLYGRVHR